MDGPKLHNLVIRFVAIIFLVAVIVLAGLPIPASASARSAPVDAAIWRAAAAGGKVRVIVQGNDTGRLAAAAAQSGGRVVRELGITRGLAVEVQASSIGSLARQPAVERVLYDAPMVSHAVRDYANFNSSRLATVYPFALESAGLWSDSSRITGKGIGVAVIDSGVSPAPDFGGDRGNRIVGFARFGSNTSPLNDRFGHGTATAGVIAGNGAQSNGKYVGLAPEANIVDLKVGDDSGAAYASDVIGAIWWAVRHRQDYNIKVINLSLTSSVPESYKTSLLSLAVEYAWFNGIVVVVAAGNGGPGGVLNPPANDPYVITVGATDDLGTRDLTDDVLASFSSYGATQDGFAKPDLVAPGRHIISVLSNPKSVLATALPGRIIDGKYIRLTGSSLSSAEVSGLVAQLLQSRPSYKPDQVKWLLAHSARAVGSGAVGTGAGYPSARAAVQFAGAAGLANRGLVPNTHLARAVAKQLFDGISWDGVSWDGVSWDGVSWDGVSWDGVSWDGVSWDGVSWDGVSWDGVSWDGVSWDGVSWDGVSWDGVSWDALPLD